MSTKTEIELAPNAELVSAAKIEGDEIVFDKLAIEKHLEAKGVSLDQVKASQKAIVDTIHDVAEVVGKLGVDHLASNKESSLVTSDFSVGSTKVAARVKREQEIATNKPGEARVTKQVPGYLDIVVKSDMSATTKKNLRNSVMGYATTKLK